MKIQGSSDLLMMSQVSTLLNVHPNTLRSWDSDGTLPAIRFGKRGDRRYKKEDVMKLIRTKKDTQSGGKYSVISLFAGCGGMDLGFEGGFKILGKQYKKNKFKVTWANDIEPNACKTFRSYFGHKIVCGDITQILDEKQNQSLLFDIPIPSTADIVIGGFPCQDFSHAGKRKGFTTKRGSLYLSMAEVIRRTKPLIFVAENVKGLLTLHKGEAIKTIIKDFEMLGYHVVPKLYLAADFGVPQMRERVLIVGTRNDVLPPFEHPESILKSTNHVSVKEAIGDLLDIDEGGIPNHFWSYAKKNKGQGNNAVNPNKPAPTMRAEHHGNIEFHWSAKRRLSAREAARIQTFPDNFIFEPSTSSAYKQIGNAVPPVLAWHLATAIQKFLDKHI